jgi:3-hydroxyacyl-CoA dehydrogenase
MFWAQQQGLDKVFAKIKEYELRYPERWKPAKLLEERAQAGAGWKG